MLELRISLNDAIKNYCKYHFAVVDIMGRIAVLICLTKTKKEALGYQRNSKIPRYVINLDKFRHNRKKEKVMEWEKCVRIVNGILKE